MQIKKKNLVFSGIGLIPLLINAQATKPNVIFILADDLGWADVGFNGSIFYETPNINKLASEGVQFTNGYAACPVSSPTRVSIMSGKYPARIQITNWIAGYQYGISKKQLSYYKLIAPDFPHNMPLEEITMAESFKNNGYKTYFIGKWHCAHDSAYYPQYQGFDINLGGWLKGSPNGDATKGRGYYSPYNNPYLTDGPENEFLTDRLTNEAIEYFKNNNSSPFFLFLSYYAVHTPIQPKPEKVAYYKQKAINMGLDTLPAFSTDFDWFRSHPQPKWHWKERIVQSSPEYAALVETLDENIGRLLSALSESGLDKETIIVFTSDNGGLSTAEGSPTSNLPLRGGKGWLYEGGIKEPYIIKAPGVTTPGSVCDIPVTSTDFYPTLLELAGIQPNQEQHVDGVSLVPALKGKKLKRKSIFWHYPHYGGKGDAPASAIRKGDWKLLEFYETGKVELYNLKNDISEKKELSQRYKSKAKRMLQELHTWQSNVNAKFPIENPDYEFQK
ncbi:MAG: sulfatase [Paludibacter sp.]|nr:sulfatase [Paludibacter sp.]